MQEMYASQTDWDMHRATITRLYLHEDRTLRGVMDYMAQRHRFYATMKMYRTRIKKWELDKNNKMAEVVEMVRIKKKRDAINKASRFTIRGRRVDWDDVERYLARNPGLHAKFQDGELEVGNADHGIVCRTPSPDPVRALAVPGNLDGARDVRVHEEILQLFTTYTAGSYDQGTWKLWPAHNRFFGPGGAKAHSRLNNWASSFRTVTDWTGSEADSVRLINSHMEEVQQIIKDEDSTLFPCLIRACFYLSSRRPLVGAQVSNFVASMFAVVLGRHHPMTRIWSRIKTLPIANYLLVLETATRVRLDHLLAFHVDGLQDDNVIRAMREYLLVLRLRPSVNAGEVNRIVQLALDMLQDVPDHQLTSHHARLLVNVSSAQMANAEYDSAEQTLDRVDAWVEQGRDTDWTFRRVEGDSLFNRGFLYMLLGRKDEAHEYLVRVFNGIVRDYGTSTTLFIDVLTGLVTMPVSRDTAENEAWQRMLREAQESLVARSKTNDSQRAIFSFMYRLEEQEGGLTSDGPWDTDVGHLHAAKLRLPRLHKTCHDILPGVMYEYWDDDDDDIKRLNPKKPKASKAKPADRSKVASAWEPITPPKEETKT
ncbi:hypothetical protein B0T24DRAFT_539550 [Lasiosphaeria ovina]|uniref:Clr5 domain-containing protein n=1 Tax=Lasiosphaeria ovina TaxID=92902 RepID=A0AAE0MYT9_9PEZI|nr:hypothetical protein B0T24DRAFT_539550 [Lasiosphaeria ovina]